MVQLRRKAKHRYPYRLKPWHKTKQELMHWLYAQRINALEAYVDLLDALRNIKH
jgi:hypothetical protein